VIVETATLIALSTLAATGVFHLRALPTFSRIVRQHRIWSYRAAPVVATCVVFGELVVGAGGMVAMFAGDEAARRLAVVLAVAAYASFTAYGAFLLRSRPGVPCGCSAGGEEPANEATVGRSAALALIAVVALLGTSSLHASMQELEFAFTLLAGSALALLTWLLPAALHLPTPSAGEPSH